MRAFIELVALVSQDSDQLRKLLDIDTAIDDTNSITASTFNGTQMTLVAGATAVSAPFGGVTNASALLIVATDNVTVQLNGGPAISVTKTPAVDTTTVLSTVQKFDQPGIVFWRGTITSVVLNNPNLTSPASVYVALVGEAA